MTTCLECFT